MGFFKASLRSLILMRRFGSTLPSESGQHSKLMSYNQVIAGIKSGDPALMFPAIGLNLAAAPKEYQAISIALGAPAGEGLLDLLLPLLKHPEYQVRVSIPSILATLGEPRFIRIWKMWWRMTSAPGWCPMPARPSSRFKARTVGTDAVKFVRTYQKLIPAPPPMLSCASLAQIGTYEEYTAPNKIVARAFLDKSPVTEDFHYIEVITPEGRLGKDRMSIY